jgi:Outer membrane protein beta-barrel domain
MNKFLSLAIIFATISFNSLAQTDAEIVKTRKNIFKANTTYKKPSKDYVMVQAGFNTWLKNTDSVINLKQMGHDINFYICNDFALPNKYLSFAAGIGLGSSAVYLDSMAMNLSSNDQFVKFKYNTGGAKRYKFSTTYFEAPFELRYFGNADNRNKGIKIAIGAKVGTLINAHTKSVNANGTSSKENSRRFNEQWRLAATARIGYGNFSLYGTYQINQVFKAGNQQGLTPISIGLCVSGL